MAAAIIPIATAVIPLISQLLPGIIQLFQKAHPIAPDADQAAKDAANAAKAAGALQTATTLAAQLAPAGSLPSDPTTLATIISGALEAVYQRMKADGTLNGTSTPATPSVPSIQVPPSLSPVQTTIRLKPGQYLMVSA
jgi:hypothetical protein